MEPLVLSADEEAQLRSLAGSRSLPHGLVRHAQIVLACAQGEANTSIARRMGLSNATVGKWRKRYLMQGIEGLHDELRSGRPRTHDDERVAEVINAALQTRPPDGSTHWTVRAMAAHTGVSKSTVQRWFSLFAVQPHRQRHFKLSNDPFFVEKVRDIVGLYLNPPDHAVVLCVDEKTQVQALNRTQPMLPMGLGYVEGVTHDYVRHGTTTLFAALNIATGQVITQCKKRHRHQEFLTFLRHIDDNIPEALDVHLIVDNYATHKHPRVRTWLARRPRYHVHYTPTYASWLNQVERWFAIITQMAIRRGSFSNVSDLVNKIELFVQHYNARATPFIWIATAESILAKIQRLCSYISGTRHEELLPKVGRSSGNYSRSRPRKGQYCGKSADYGEPVSPTGLVRPAVRTFGGVGPDLL
jgi:transposase